MLHKQINTVSILLLEMHPCHVSVITQSPIHAGSGERETAMLYRIFENLDCVNAFRQLPHKPNNHFVRGVLNYVPSE